MNPRNAILKGRFAGQAWSACALCAIMATAAPGQDSTESEGPVEVSDYGTVTLAVQDTDLAQVLEMLSIQSQKNIITSKNVSATISANLFDVTFHEALDSILKVNGYDYREEGNFIYIYTQAEIDEMEAALLKPEAKIYELDYLAAADANELITPLLSDSGRSSFRGDVEPGIEADSSSAGEDGWAFTAMLVVNDFPENLVEITALLQRLDTPPQQVLIEATILQTTLDEADAFGIDFNIIGDMDFTDLTNPLSAVTNLLAGDDENNGFQPDDNRARGIASTPGNTAGPGTFKVGVVSNDVSFFLKLLDEVTDSTVLARPKVMCLNRQRAEVLVGARVGYLSTTATETSTTQTVEFLDTGIHLMFRPFISKGGMIRLEMAPSVSEASLRLVTDAQGLSVTIPDELTNEITTNVRVQDGHTIVLGGLFRESNRSTRRQVPLLGDIPIVGAAFRGHDDSIDRDEIIFLITPTIIHDESAWALGEGMLAYTDEIVVGARRGLLPFSREKLTTNENSRAQEAFNRGDVDRALYHINNSLRHNARQPEVIRFRERILGVREAPHERSLLEEVFRKELGTMGVSPGAASVNGIDRFYDTTFVTESAMPVEVASAGSNDQRSDVADATNDASGDESFGVSLEADGFEETFENSTEVASAESFETEPVAAVIAEPAPVRQAHVFTEEEKQAFADRFVHEYFTALGLSFLSPYGEAQAMGESDDESFPFVTFEDMFGGEIAEPVGDQTTAGAEITGQEVVEAQNETTPND